MSVKVRIPTILRTYTGGQAEVPAEGTKLSEVIESLEKDHPGIAARVLDDQGKLRRFVNVYVNDDDVRFEGGLETATPDGAGISIIPAVAAVAEPPERLRGPPRPLLNAVAPSATQSGGGNSAWLSTVQLGKPPSLRVPPAYENAPGPDKKQPKYVNPLWHKWPLPGPTCP